MLSGKHSFLQTSGAAALRSVQLCMEEEGAEDKPSPHIHRQSLCATFCSTEGEAEGTPPASFLPEG